MENPSHRSFTSRQNRIVTWCLPFVVTAGLTVQACSLAPSQDGIRRAVLEFQVPTKSTPLVELLTISEDDGNPLFGAVGWQTFGNHDQIYVSDYQANQVHEYTAEGKFLRSIGGPGDGPGEFQIPVMMQVFGDSLYVFDNQNLRLSVFDQTTGTFLRSQKLEADGWRPWRLVRVVPEGLVVSYSPSSRIGVDEQDVAADEIRLVPFGAADASSASTLWQTPGPEMIPLVFNGFPGNRVKPLGNSSECAFRGDMGYCAYSAAVILHGFSITGDSLQTLTVPTEPRPVTIAERDSILARFSVKEVRDQIVVAETHPEFSGFILIDDAGRVWIRRTSAIQGSTDYWILDPQTDTIQSVTLPGSVLLYDIKNGRAIGRRTHDSGLVSVHVFATPIPN